MLIDDISINLEDPRPWKFEFYIVYKDAYDIYIES